VFEEGVNGKGFGSVRLFKCSSAAAAMQIYRSVLPRVLKAVAVAYL
jgi:hypothetical protein